MKTKEKKAVREFREELLDELLSGAKTQEQMFGAEGLLPQLTAALLQRALKAELSVHLKQQAQQTTAVPLPNRRNGSSAKTLQTEQGPVPLQIPRDRNGTFEPLIVPKHITRLPSLNEKILALYARGLSTRDIEQQLRELYQVDVSPQLISEVTESIREEITAWQGRPIEPIYMVLWIDCLMVRIRHEGTVQNKAVYVAIGLRADGTKEVLGLWIQTTEGAKFWLHVLSDLRGRGLADILILCCDGLKGLPEAVAASFPKTVVQTCIVHQIRYSLSFVNWRDRKAVVSSLKEIYQANNEQEALEALARFEKQWNTKYPMIAKSWINNWENLAPYLSLPRELRRMVYTTNTVESLNYQLRRVLKTKGHFPNDDAVFKLLFLAIRNIESKWKNPPPEWHQIFNQLVIHFGDRIQLQFLQR